MKEGDAVSLNRRWLLLPAAAASALILYPARAQLALLLRLLAGGGVIAYLLCPLSRWFSLRFRMSRVPSVLCAYLCVFLAFALMVTLLLPPLLRQMRELIAAIPSFADSARMQLAAINRQLGEKGFSRLSLPEPDWERALSSLPPLLGGTASLAGSLVARLTEWTLILMLSYYFLRDRERLSLHIELLIPASFRRTAIRMALSVHREIGAFLRSQLLISAIVAALSAVGLLIAGVHSFLALGLIVGLFNMVPYFGPVLGAIPALLMALTQGPLTALLAGAALFAVQQADSLFISPRIMGALTGLHPAWVLLVITLGSSFMGLTGMLLAVPAALALRAIARVWASEGAADEQV